jgi:hypothetical protein
VDEEELERLMDNRGLMGLVALLTPRGTGAEVHIDIREGNLRDSTLTIEWTKRPPADPAVRAAALRKLLERR